MEEFTSSRIGIKEQINHKRTNHQDNTTQLYIKLDHVDNWRIIYFVRTYFKVHFFLRKRGKVVKGNIKQQQKDTLSFKFPCRSEIIKEEMSWRYRAGRKLQS